MKQTARGFNDQIDRNLGWIIFIAFIGIPAALRLIKWLILGE